jgi:hypothetical protein
MKIILTALSLLLFCVNANAAHEGVTHYVGQKVANSQEAAQVLNAKIADINKILKKKKLSDQDLEKVHEISYSLETASDKLLEENSNNPAVEEIAESVQALHFSSEKHMEKETREWFKVLSKSAKKL